MHDGGGENEESLQSVGDDEPEAEARIAQQVADLAGQISAGQKESKGDGDVGGVEGGAIAQVGK